MPTLCLSILLVGCATTTRPEPVLPAQPAPSRVGSVTPGVLDVGPVRVASYKPFSGNVFGHVTISQPGPYTVVAGDTLFSIASRELGDGGRWRDIVSANPGLAPDRLRVGQVLELP